MNKKFIALISALLLSLTTTMFATERITFSYNTDNEQTGWIGLDTIGTSDLAIRINNIAFIGAKVTAMEVPVSFTADKVTDLTAWMSTRLTLDSDGVNAPNISSQSASIENGMLKVTFDNPYEITLAGVYVGYSFNIPKLSDSSTRYPMPAVQATSNAGYYFHHSLNPNYTKWKNIALSTGYNNPMVVYLEGDFDALGLTAVAADKLYTIIDQESQVKFVITNTGANAIRTIEYTTTIDGKAKSSQVTLPAPLSIYNSSTTLKFDTPAASELGASEIKLDITGINGTTLSSPYTVSTPFTVLPFLPKRRPLSEEYTGLWCGYCPRGYVALEEMNEKYPDDFVALAYHSGDEMQVIGSFPSSVPGYPYAYIDRTLGIDPGEIPSYWQEYTKAFTPADIDVELSWTDDSKQSVTATATLNFALDIDDANYRLSLVLVGDGMYNKEWTQANNFTGNRNLTGKYWDLFTKAGSAVSGLIYNDVVLASPNIRGVANSVPTTIKRDTPVTYSQTFNLNDITCKVSGGSGIDYGDNLAVLAGELHAVAILLDSSDNSVLNCAKSQKIDNVFVPAGINSITDDLDNVDVVSTTYIDMQGRVIVNPSAGNLYIKREILSNGNIRHSKTILK